jgi:hypothetical protein
VAEFQRLVKAPVAGAQGNFAAKGNAEKAAQDILAALARE